MKRAYRIAALSTCCAAELSLWPWPHYRATLLYCKKALWTTPISPRRDFSPLIHLGTIYRALKGVNSSSLTPKHPHMKALQIPLEGLKIHIGPTLRPTRQLLSGYIYAPTALALFADKPLMDKLSKFALYGLFATALNHGRYLLNR